MADREKVIKGLEHCTRPSEVGKGGNFCMDCPYTEPVGFNQFKCNSKQMMRDALALLKEQDAVEPFHKCSGKSFSLIEDSNYDYCPYCGKPITWAKQEGR